jgi:hypothetical protein
VLLLQPGQFQRLDRADLAQLVHHNDAVAVEPDLAPLRPMQQGGHRHGVLRLDPGIGQGVGLPPGERGPVDLAPGRSLVRPWRAARCPCGCGARGNPLVDALTGAREVLSETAGTASLRHPAPAAEAAAEAAILAAHAALAQAVQKGNLTRDPLRFALGGISEALGAFLAGIKATRQPIDPAAQAEMVRQVIAAAAAGAKKEAARLARTHNRRTLLSAALTLFVVAGAGAGGGYFWGRASAAADIQAMTVELATAFRHGPAAARSWLELMRNNDVQAALRHCTGPATWTDQ